MGPSQVFRPFLASLVAAVGSASLVTPALAAERVRFQFGHFSRSVAVPSLAEFSRNGTVDAELHPTFRHLKPEARQALRSALSQPMPVDAPKASKFLSTALGQSSLQQLVKVVAQPPQIARPALSSALILGAGDRDELRFIDVLEAYPTAELPINVEALLSLGRQLKQQFNLQNALFSTLSPMAGAPATAPDVQALAQPGSIAYSEEPFQFTAREGKVVSAVAFVPASASTDQLAPLVVIAPGLNTDMNALLYAGRQLASHGYAVASLNFPFTSSMALQAVIQGTGAIPKPNTWYGQPLTISDLIDQVQSRWGDRVNTNRVGALGQSLGGYTVTALAGAPLDWNHLVQGCAPMNDPNTVVLNPAVVWQCVAPGKVVQRRSFRDPRVTVALAINPVTSPIFSADSMASIEVPILMIAATNDIFAPPVSQQLIPFSGLRQQAARLVVQNKGTHMSFLDGTGDLPEFVIGPDQARARKQLQGLALAWFDHHLRGRGDAAGFPRVSASLLSGQDPLQLLVLPPFTREQLHQVAPHLRQFP